MTTQQVQCKARILMEEHGLIEKGWSFKIDNAKRRFGCCKHRTKEITISGYLLPHVENDADVVDTILHEIAHALVGHSHGHNYVWKAKARELGCRPERCGSHKIKDRSKLNEKYKWVGECPNGHTVKRHKLTKKGRNSSCAQCSKTFDPQYKFTWKQNN